MIKWIVLATLVFVSLIATIVAGALRLNMRPGESHDRVVRWATAAQIMWVITGTAVLVIEAVAHS